MRCDGLRVKRAVWAMGQFVLCNTFYFCGWFGLFYSVPLSAYISVQHILYLWYPWNGLVFFNAGIHKKQQSTDEALKLGICFTLHIVYTISNFLFGFYLHLKMVWSSLYFLFSDFSYIKKEKKKEESFAVSLMFCCLWWKVSHK